MSNVGRVLKSQKVVEDVMGQMRTEFKNFMQEVSAERNEYERRFQSQLVEISNMQRAISDLNRSLLKMKSEHKKEMARIKNSTQAATPEITASEHKDEIDRKEKPSAVRVGDESEMEIAERERVNIASSMSIDHIERSESKNFDAEVSKMESEDDPPDKASATDFTADWTAIPNPDLTSVPKIELSKTLFHNNVVCCVEFSNDGKYLASGSNRSAHVFSVETGGELFSLVDGDIGPRRPQRRRSDRTRSSNRERESNDNEVATVASLAAANGSEVTSGEFIRSVSFSPDNKYLATGAEDKSIKIWSLETGEISQRMVGHRMDIYSLVYAPNSKYIVSGSGDENVIVWDASTSSILRILTKNGLSAVTSVSVSPDSRYVAAGSIDRNIRIWEVETGKLMRELEGHNESVYSVSFSPDGSLLASGSSDKSLRLWDLSSFSSRNCTEFRGHKDYVLSARFMPDGRSLISGSKDMTVRVWDIRESVASVVLNGHRNSVISVATNPIGGMIASGSGDTTARLWNCNY